MRTMIGHLISDLGPAASVVIVGGAVLGLYRVAARWYGRTVGSRRNLTRRLNQLAAGVTLRYVEERFGTPAFARVFGSDRLSGRDAVSASQHLVRDLVRAVADPGTTASGASDAVGTSGRQAGLAPSRQIRELIYRERHAWLQVLVDENDAVIRFSITVTDPRFRFSTRNLTWGHLTVKLGRSRFSEVHGRGFSPDGRSLRIGAHNREYAEAYWFGNPGQYQRYVLSSNEIGTGGFGYLIERHGPSFARQGSLAFDYELPAGRPEFDPDAGYARRFREETTINTLTILGPGGRKGDLAEPRGPGSNHVRVLVPSHREQRQIRRRMRRLDLQEPDTNRLRAHRLWLQIAPARIRIGGKRDT